jgi:hypothetical protein
MKELIEWMEGEELRLDQNLADWATERARAIEHCITKAKELEADREDILAIKMKECDEWRDKFENWSNKLEDEIKKLQTYRLQLQAEQDGHKWAVVHITDEYDSPEEAQEHIETIHKKMRQYYRIVKITTI